ncbi:MAG: hypothetical protein KGI27_10980 [Thaumarchaeota archaeon]|nr:hypothetical protein [Nitrososphaerota archaeon]
MKILLCLLFAVAAISAFSLAPSYESGMIPCCLNINLDKTEYNPGDPVNITVMESDNIANSSGEVSITIYDVTYGQGNEKTVYQDKKSFENGKAEFEFKAPQSPDRYIYLVTAQSQHITKSKLFFTKKDASKIVISDVKVLTPKVMQGEQLKLEVKVLDGLGNKIHGLRVIGLGEIPEISCADKIPIYPDLSPTNSNQPMYWTDGTVNGTILIMPYAKPGSYDLTLRAGSEIDGYQTSNATIHYEVTENPDKPTPFSVIHAPLGVDYDKNKFFAGQPIRVHSFTAYDDCGDIIPNVPITAEMKRYDFQKSTYIQTLQTKNVTSDKNGTFSVTFDPVGLRAGDYTVLVTSHYPGVNETFGIADHHNKKNFTISELGKNFTVSVDGWDFIPLNAAFDRQDKKLTLDLDSSDSFRRVDFTVPNELLDGKFTVLVNGQERDGDIQKHQGYTSFSPWPGQENHTAIEVIGTTAIPEFPFAVPVLLISVVSVIVFYRIKFRMV